MPKGDKNILKADPEDGTTPVSNTLLVAVALSKLSALEIRAVLHLWRQTYGWVDDKKKRRKERTISLREWADALNTCRPNAHKVLKSLENKHVIKVKRFGKGKSNSYATNTLISEWTCVDKERLAKRLKVVGQEANTGVGQMANTALFKPPTPQDTNSASPKESTKESIKENMIKKKEIPPPTAQESQILEVLESLPKWECDDTDDLAWLRQLLEDYPHATIHHFKCCRDYYSEDPTKNKGQWKKRIRNWLGKEIDLQGEKNGTPGGTTEADYDWSDWKKLAGEGEGLSEGKVEEDDKWADWQKLAGK